MPRSTCALGGPTVQRNHAGFTLVEVVVAMFVLAIVFAGAAATVIAVIGVVQVNESRAVASNAVQAEMERLRTLPYEDLVGFVSDVQEREVELGGRRFGVRSSVEFATLEVDADSCVVDLATLPEQMVRVDIEAWPVHRPEQLSLSSTTIARLPDELPAGQGTMSVSVTDHQDPPQPVDLVRVDVLSPTDPPQVVAFDTTDARGCVLFSDLDEGNYRVRVSRPEYVGIEPGPDEESPVRTGSVIAGTNVNVDLRYAPAGRFSPLTLAWVDGVDAVLAPMDLDLTVARRGRSKVVDLDDGSITPVWPGSWDVWAGSCPSADPEGATRLGGEEDADQVPFWGVEASRGAPVVAADLGLTPLEVPVVAVQLVDPEPPGDPGPPADPGPPDAPGTPPPAAPEPVFSGRTLIQATARSVLGEPACEGGRAELNFDVEPEHPAYDVPHGPLTIALPLGVWDLTISRPGGGASTLATVEALELGPASLEQLVVVEVDR